MARKPSPARRKAFLDAALKLFVENGIQNTSTSAIAKEAGSASGTLFLYFPTKQDLIHELVLQISRNHSEYIQKQLDPTLPVRDTFFTIWNGSIRWFWDHMDAFLYIQQIRESGLIADSVVQETEKHLAYYFVAIQKGREQGALKPYPYELIGNMLYHDMVAVMNLIRTQQDPTLQETYLNEGFKIFWDGIKT